LLLEAFAAPRALLLGVPAEIVEVFSFHVFVNQGAVDGLSCGKRFGQQGVSNVRGAW
jgi:hypothetical protein